MSTAPTRIAAPPFGSLEHIRLELDDGLTHADDWGPQTHERLGYLKSCVQGAMRSLNHAIRNEEIGVSTRRVLCESINEQIEALKLENSRLRADAKRLKDAARFALVELGEAVEDSDLPDVLEGHEPLTSSDCPPNLLAAINCLREATK